MATSGLLWVGLARAEPFWVRWSAADDGFPTDSGWAWGATTPAPRVSLEGFQLAIDSLSAWGLAGGYYRCPAEMVPTGPVELFVLRWRVHLQELHGLTDPGVIIRAPDSYSVVLDLDREHVRSLYELTCSAPFSPDEPHDFVLETADMRAYRLYIDGQLSLEGTFFHSSLPGSEVGWGDQASAQSLSLWEYVEFGVTVSSMIGDLNCDGRLDSFDIDPFVKALTDPTGYAVQYPSCDSSLADINGDGAVNAFDIDAFVALLVPGRENGGRAGSKDGTSVFNGQCPQHAVTSDAGSTYWPFFDPMLGWLE